MHPMCNTASDADVYEIDLQEHDLVLLATDGVFDNLWDDELAALIRSYIDVSPRASSVGRPLRVEK